MKRILLLLLLVWPAGVTARVISYAPYTDQVAIRAHQPRTTRWFALVETTPAAAYDGLMYGGKVVLYDSTGAEPPREVFPQPTNFYYGAIRQVGLYERPGSPEPVLVVVAGIPNSSSTWISSNGGRSWRRIEELENLRPRQAKEPDRGGPWSHGLGAPLRVGNNAWPFVISFVEGVYAISETRPPKLLFAGQTTDNSLLGQNRSGTQFLIQTHRNTLITTDHTARWRSVGNVVGNPVTGWIADDGSIYVVTADESKRSVYRYVNRRETLVASSDLETSFAVPTADFSGFWYIEHEPKTTTNLKRYTPANGLETVWEDADAPEVEALHADDSGDALLIQVHRERAKQDLSFLDPALAVWRVGEPAPAVYDELFLIEGPRKGFVHLDVEAVAAGAPFVFDSGYVRPAPPDVIISPPMTPPPAGGGGGVIQEWGVVRASLEQRLVLQGVTRTTDLVISNPVQGKQSVRIELGDRATTIELESQEIRVIALSSLFELGEGTATLHLLPQYGIAALAHVRTSGGAGYAVQAVDWLNASSPRFPVTFSGATPGAGFRSNLILTDTSGHGIDARVQACTTSGLAGDARVALDASEAIEDANAVIVQPRRGSLIAGVVAVDELSGDASYFTPDIPAPSVRTIPFVANTESLVSELYLLNLSSTTRSVMLEVKPYDSNQWPRQQTYRLLPYETRVIANPLKTLFGMSGIARLRYASWGQPGDTTGVRVTSRAYTVAANGGTYGSAVPPLNSFQSVTADEALEILGIRSGFTASLGLVELSPNPRNQPAKVRVTITDERGNRLDSFETTVQPAGGVLIDDLFASRKIAQPAAARVTVEALDAWALVGAYAVITEPATKDPTYLGPNLAAKPK